MTRDASNDQQSGWDVTSSALPTTNQMNGRLTVNNIPSSYTSTNSWDS